MLVYLKFRFSEKATKIGKNLPLVLTLLRKFQKKWEIFFKLCGLLTIMTIMTRYVKFWLFSLKLRPLQVDEKITFYRPRVVKTILFYGGVFYFCTLSTLRQIMKRLGDKQGHVDD